MNPSIEEIVAGIDAGEYRVFPNCKAEFVASIVSQYSRNGRITQKQEYWLRRCTQKKEHSKEPDPEIQRIVDNIKLTDYEIIDPNSRSFVEKIISFYEKSGRMTKKQKEAIQNLLKPMPTIKHVSDVLRIFHFLTKASQILKAARITLQTNKGLFLLRAPYLPVEEDNQVVDGKVRMELNNRNMGYLKEDGTWVVPSSVDEVTLKFVKTQLTALNENPLRVIRANGNLTGVCVFCRRRLTDERSLDMGFGPVCAGNYGLYKYWKSGSLDYLDDESDEGDGADESDEGDGADESDEGDGADESDIESLDLSLRDIDSNSGAEEESGS